MIPSQPIKPLPKKSKLDFKMLEKTLYIMAGIAALVVITLSLTITEDPSAPHTKLPPMDVKTITIETASGELVTFDAEIAISEAHITRGMMHRDHIDDNKGMLFMFDPPRQVSFWMRNTRIPLDIIYINADGRIMNIAAMAKPMDETPLPSSGEAAAVLEIRGGLAAQKGISAGNSVDLPPIGGF